MLLFRLKLVPSLGTHISYVSPNTGQIWLYLSTFVHLQKNRG